MFDIDMDTTLKKLHDIFDNTCAICTETIPKTVTRHRLSETCTICDTCWNKLKFMMNQEENI